MAIFLNHGVVAFQPSATSEFFSARHFFLLRVVVGLIAVQKGAGDEQADVRTAELPVAGARWSFCPPTQSRADAQH